MTVETGPPDEVQEMLTLSPSEIVILAYAPTEVLGDAACFIKYHLLHASVFNKVRIAYVQ